MKTLLISSSNFRTFLGFAVFVNLVAFAACSAPRSVGNSRTSKAVKGGEPAKTTTASSASASANSPAAQLSYITSFKDVAVAEMYRSGIPASIKLAQALLESASGTSDLAQNANNHFGIKCAGQTWTGGTYFKQDDDRDEKGDLKESCFRRYTTVAESYSDHTAFLRDPRKQNRYGFLFNLDRTDYKGWAKGLQSSGYATSSEYADRLIGLIEKFKLYEYDNEPPGVGTAAGTGNTSGTTGGPRQIGDNQKPQTNPNAPVIQQQRRIGEVNGSKVILVTSENETLSDLARLYRIPLDRLLSYNDYGFPPAIPLKKNSRVFLEEKRDRYAGRTTFHYVREGQTMFDIAQQYGIDLNSLLQRNGMQRNQEPAVGQQVRLKGNRKRNETVRLRDTATDTTPPMPIPEPARPGSLDTDENAVIDMGGMTGENSPAATDNTNSIGARPVTTDTPYPPDPLPVSRPSEPLPTTVPPVYPDQPLPTTTPQYNTHVVIKGDTLFSLARRYNTTVEELKRLNNLGNNAIQVGQSLRYR